MLRNLRVLGDGKVFKWKINIPALSKSPQSEKTTRGLLPPSSRVTRFKLDLAAAIYNDKFAQTKRSKIWVRIDKEIFSYLNTQVGRL